MDPKHSNLQNPVAPRLRARRKDARPGEILEAALTVFIARGYAATRMDDVARSADISKGTLYLYFANKAELFKAAVRQVVIPALEEAEREVATVNDMAWLLMERRLRVWWQREAPQRGITQLILSEARHFPDIAAFYREEVVDRAHAVIELLIRRGIENGEFRTVPLPETARLVVAPMIYQTLWQSAFGVSDRDSADLLEAYLQFLRIGLQPVGDRG